MISYDVSMHNFWMHKWSQSDKFQPDDIIAEMAELIQPWGYNALNRILAYLLTPLTIVKYMPLTILFFCCCYLFFLLEEQVGLRLSILAVCIFPFLIMDQIIGFHARAFGYLILTSFLYYMTNRNLTAVSIVFVLGTLFYPPVLLMVITAAVLYLSSCFLRFNGNFIRWKYLPVLGISIVICGTILTAKSTELGKNPIAGKIVTKTELLEMEEFGDKGRYNIAGQLKPLLEILPKAIKSHKTVLAIPILCYLISLMMYRKITEFDVLLMAYFLSGILLFFAARIFAFRLYYPFRYWFYAYLPFSFFVFFRTLSHWKKILNNSFVFVFVTCVGIILSFQLVSLEDSAIKDHSRYSTLYERVKQIDNRVLIAGPAGTCDQIPFFCKQTVLFSRAATHALQFKSYWSKMKPRILDFYEAYTTADKQVLIEFIQKYDVDYIIIDKKFFESGEIDFFEPITRFIRHHTLGKTLTDYAILQLKKDLIEPVDERFSLINCQKLFGQ